jgi:hypothetical protein
MVVWVVSIPSLMRSLYLPDEGYQFRIGGTPPF